MASDSLDSCARVFSLRHSSEVALPPRFVTENCPLACPREKLIPLLIQILKNAVFKAGILTSCKEMKFFRSTDNPSYAETVSAGNGDSLER